MSSHNAIAMGKACTKCGGLTRLSVLLESANDFKWPSDGNAVTVICPNGHAVKFLPSDDLLRWKEASAS